MTYIRVEWRQQNSLYPNIIFSELDDQRWEIRKVEIFPDGTKGYASNEESSGRTALGEDAVPTVLDINSDPQFAAEEITRSEFESVWASAKDA